MAFPMLTARGTIQWRPMASASRTDDFWTSQPSGPAGRSSYRLGAPISLADLLALPPDGNRYSRDEKGRLILTPPDHFRYHRTPLAALAQTFGQQLDRKQYLVVPEARVAFDPIYILDGTIVPPSHHGLPSLEPDLACIRRPVQTVRVSKENEACSQESVILIVEFLSQSTWRSDLGDGRGDDVDRWRTYLECGVSEYWVVNANDEAYGLPPRSCLL